MGKAFSSLVSKIALAVFAAGLLFGGLLAFTPDEVLIRSLESKTADGGPVFNRIRFLRQGSRRIWMMNQSHHGPAAAPSRWDRLAIVMEPGPSGTVARFLQLPPGPLEWRDELLTQGTAYRVSCFMCHRNGPRAIRPDGFAGLGQSLRIFVWNLGIKTAGLVAEHPIHAKEDATLKVPFRHRGRLDNETLSVGVCLHCHTDEGLFARGKLTRQNGLAIDFMVRSRLMPPPGFPLSTAERKKIDDFVAGF